MTSSTTRSGVDAMKLSRALRPSPTRHDPKPVALQVGGDDLAHHGLVVDDEHATGWRRDDHSDIVRQRRLLAARKGWDFMDCSPLHLIPEIDLASAPCTYSSPPLVCSARPPSVEFVIRLIGDDGRVTVDHGHRSPPFLPRRAAIRSVASSRRRFAPRVDFRKTTRWSTATSKSGDGVSANPSCARCVRSASKPMRYISKARTLQRPSRAWPSKLDVDIVVMGATRPIFDQSAWESVSARVTLECNKPVLVLPPPTRPVAGPTRSCASRCED